MGTVEVGVRGRRGAVDDASDLASDAPAVEPDYLQRNRTAWESWASDHIAIGRRAWEDTELRWGVWELPESELQLVGDLGEGLDVVELGCGTASVASWLARYGHRAAAVDFARAQLETAIDLQREHAVDFRLVHANVEKLPYDGASFDLAVSEYGASLWSDPRYWLPEAHRVLKPGGKLIFFTNGALLMACTPTDGTSTEDVLVRDMFAPARVEFPSSVEFHLRHGLWIQALRTCGFDLEGLIEVRPPAGATARYGFLSLDWAQRWPSEEIWIARKRA